MCVSINFYRVVIHVDINNGKAIGPFTLTEAPTDPDHAVRLQDLDNLGNSARAPIFITNVTPQSTGNIGEKVYLATIPANQVLTEATADVTTVRVHFLAESGTSFYNPTVTYEGNPVTNMTEVANDRRLYQGYQDVTLTESGVVTLTSSTGATAAVNITLAIGGPAITALTLGAYPGSQTEVKAGDIVSFTGTVANTATAIQVTNAGVASAVSGSVTLGALNSAGAGFRTFSGNLVVANRTGTFNATLTASNQLGTVGNPFNSSNTMVLNQTVPTIAVPSVSYPAGQEAVKNTQSFTVAAAVANADGITYTFSRGTVDNSTTIATNKTLNVTSAVYEVGTNNYTIVATRAANGSSTTRTAAIAVAGVAAQISINITGSPTRLRSSPAGEVYTVNITSNQSVHTTEAPTLQSVGAGAWVGSWTRSGNVWSRQFRIDDSDTPGNYSFSGLSLMNKALIETTAITAGASFTIGGFVIRTITFPAFSRYQPIGATVTTNAKVRAQYAGTGSDLTLRTDTNSAQVSFTLVDSAGNYAPTGGTHLFISDLEFANANTAGTLQLTIEELI